MTGQIVGIRWRYTVARDQQRRNGDHPERAADQEPRARCSRGAATSASRGGATSSSRCPTTRRRRGSSPSSRRRSRAPRSATWRRIRPVVVLCTGFGDSAIHYVVRYWLTDLGTDIWTDSQVRLHVAATLARHGMEMPLAAACADPQPQPPGAPEVHERELAARCGDAREARALRCADRRRAARAGRSSCRTARTSPTT